LEDKEATFLVEGMKCASCATNIERELSRLRGVSRVSVSFLTKTLVVRYSDNKVREEIKRSVKRLGYELRAPTAWARMDPAVWTRLIVFLIGLTLTVPVVYITLFHYSYKHNFLLFLLSTPVQILLGRKFYEGAWNSLKRGFANMDVLIALSVSAAYAYSVAATFLFEGQVFYEASTTVLTTVYFGSFLENLAEKKVEESIQRLMSYRPETATLLRDGREIEVSAEELSVGDVVLVRPGESVPVDGVVVEGYSSVDESIVTGESMPIDKKVGDKVIGGSVNKFGVLKVRAEKVGRDTAISQILRIVEGVLLTKAPIQRVVDRVTHYFVPFVVLVSVISFSAWYFLVGVGFLFALTVATAVLVIACPCALGLATPTALMVGMGKGAESGVLIRNAGKLEVIRKATTVVLDKTGTLTKGEPEVVVVSSRRALELAAIAEKNSEHPIAKAIRRTIERERMEVVDPEGFRVIPGRGVSAFYNGKEILVGNLALMSERGVDTSETSKEILFLQERGVTALVVAYDGKIAGFVGVADKIKEGSRGAVKKMKEMGLEVIMLTGDDRRVAKAVAQELYIDEFLAEVLPSDKAQKIKELQGKVKTVVMVGDGINDAPALAQADIGIAVGSGADMAKLAGDIILMKDDVRDVALAIELGRKTVSKIKQNLLFAFFYNAFSIPVAAGVLHPYLAVLITPTISAIAMLISDIVVVGNSLLLKRYKFKA